MPKSHRPSSPQHEFPPIRVLDAVMGAGKTTKAKEMLRKTNEEVWSHVFRHGGDPTRMFPSYIYVTPFIKEAEKVVEDCPTLDFKLPDKDVMGTKGVHLEYLIKRGENVVTSHTLFSMLDEETCKALRDHNYALIIDEAINSVEVYDKLTRNDVHHLLDSNLVRVEDDGRLVWTGGERTKDIRYEDVRQLCNARAIYLYGESAIIWELPPHVLRYFRQVTVLTYLWEASPMCAYLKAEGIPVEVLGMERGGGPKPRSQVSEVALKHYVRKHLHIIDSPRMNDLGNRPQRKGAKKMPLTSTWYKEAGTPPKEALSRKLESFAKNGPESIDHFAWTTFARQREKVERSRFAKPECWLPVNARASNAYRHKTHLAYPVDIYPHVNLSNYFRSRGVHFSADLFALSEILQWLWRGCIRDLDSGKDMTVYVPSERMRGLLKLWVESDSLSEVYEALGVELETPSPAMSRAA